MIASDCEADWNGHHFKRESMRHGTMNYRSSPARDLARLRKKSMTFLAAPELPE
jgi:hypothetical protein